MKPLKFHRDGDGTYFAQAPHGRYIIRRYEKYFNLYPRPATYTYWDLYYVPQGQGTHWSSEFKLEHSSASTLKRNAVKAAQEHHAAQEAAA